MTAFCRKYVSKIALGLSFVLAVVLAVRLNMPLVRISPEACAEIQPGMTVQEVEMIIGGRPGFYDGIWGIDQGAVEDFDIKDTLGWCGSDGDIEVEFGDRGVIRAAYRSVGILGRSWSRFAWERLTRNGFEGIDPLYVNLGWGICLILSIAFSLTMVTTLLRLGKTVDACGLMLTLGFGVVIGLVAYESSPHDSFLFITPFWAILGGVGLFALWWFRLRKNLRSRVSPT